MKIRRLGSGHYEMTGVTTLDGKPATIRVSIWRHEEIRGCWMSNAEIDGRSTGTFNDHRFKSSAVAAAKLCAEHGYETVPGLGVCVAAPINAPVLPRSAAG